MARTTRWTTTLDGRPLTLRAVHAPEDHALTLSLDGHPVKRFTLPDLLWGPHRVEVESDGHRVALTLVPGEERVRCEAQIDGQRLQADAHTFLHHEEDGRAWPIAGLVFDAERYDRLHPAQTRPWRAALAIGAGLICVAAFEALSHLAHSPPADVTLAAGLTATLWGAGWRWSLRRQMQDRLATGAVHPAMVVSAAPPRVAVQVRSEAGEVPWLLVVDQPLHRLGPVQLGDRLAVVVDEGAAPPKVIPVDLATGDRAATRALRDRLDADAWRSLEQDWRAVGAPEAAGRYALRPETRMRPVEG